jgi:hypothetical protein
MAPFVQRTHSFMLVAMGELVGVPNSSAPKAETRQHPKRVHTTPCASPLWEGQEAQEDDLHQAKAGHAKEEGFLER